MTLFNPEKIQEAQKAQLELLQQISGKIFESVEQLTQLQFKSLREASTEQLENFRSQLSVTDPQDLAKLQASVTQPNTQTERLMELNREVYELISSTHADIAKLAENQANATAQQTQELIEALSKNAPAGAEPAVAMFKTALESVNSTYESVQKAAQKASKMAEEGIIAAAAAGKASADTAKPKAATKK